MKRGWNRRRQRTVTRSRVESNELFPSALSATEIIEAQYMCRLSKKVEKDRKCREEEGLGCCLKSGKIERWLKRSIDRSSITKHWYIHDIPWKISWPIIIYFHSITLLYLRIPHIDHIFIIIVSYSLMHYLSFLIFPPRTFATFSKKKNSSNRRKNEKRNTDRNDDCSRRNRR